MNLLSNNRKGDLELDSSSSSEDSEFDSSDCSTNINSDQS